MNHRSLITRFTGLSLLLAAGACALSACSAADSSDNGSLSAEEEQTSQVGQALDWKSALCKIANAVPSFDVAGFKISKSCSYNTWDELSYFGSNGASDGDYAKTLATTTYCALADSSGDWVGATVQTPVGQFGAVSNLHSFARDNQKRHIETEHTGSVVAFGVKIPMQYNTTAWDFSTEAQPAQSAAAQHDSTVFISVPNSPHLLTTHKYSPYTQQLTAQTGYYQRRVEQNLTKWSVGGNGFFYVGPVKVTVDTSLASEEGANTWNNGQFSPSPPAYAGYKAYVDPYNLCVAECKRNGQSFCEAVCGYTPTPTQIAGHELLCNGGCTAAYFANLNDGILPYSGHGSGARADILFWDPVTNFTEHGFPGTAGVAGTTEKPYSLLSAPVGTSTAFKLGVKADFTAGIASIGIGSTLKFDTRVGAALRSSSAVRDLGSGERATVSTQVDAEAAVNLDASLNMSIDLSPFPPLTFSAAYDLIDRQAEGHIPTKSKTRSTYSWTVNRDGANNANTSACTAVNTPDGGTPTLPPKSGADAIYDFAAADIDNLHPCNVKVCVPSSPGSQQGRLFSYSWDAAARKLVASKWQTSCNICDSTASVCNAAGTVLSAMKTNTSAQCGGSGALCGGREACDANDDCSSPSATCDGAGCCVIVK